MTTCLVTGSSRRMGRVLTENLVQLGYNPILHHASSEEEAAQFQEELERQNTESWLFPYDLKEASSIYQSTRTFLEELDLCPTVLVNCASQFLFDDFASVTYDSLLGHFDVNLFSPVLLAKAIVDNAEKQGQIGSVVIINIIDFKVYSASPDYFSYTLTKFALNASTGLMAKALADKAVRVCSISPGFTLSAPEQSEEEFESIRHMTPLGYGPTANNIAQSMRFIIENPALTGVDIPVDSGMRFRAFEQDVALTLSQQSHKP